MAVIHTLINILGTVILLPIYLIANSLFSLPIANAPIDAFGIALCHTLFNVLATMILMPNGKLIIKLTEWLTKEKAGLPKADPKAQICVLDERLLRSPSVAVQECANYTEEMCTTAHDTLTKAMSLMAHYEDEGAEEIVELEDVVDLYEDRF